MLRTISTISLGRFQNWLITSLLCCLMAACGGGGGGGQSTGGFASQPNTITSPSGVTLALVASATDSFGGGAAITVDAQVLNSTATVQWQLTGAGSLSNASGPSVTYTPPATVTADATVTIQATLPDPDTPLTRTVAVNVRAAIVNASASAAQVFTDDLVGVALSAAPQFTGGPVTWSLTGPGSLSATSGTGINYLPPTVLASITPVTITASAGGVSQNLSISVVPAAFRTLVGSATQAFAGGAAVTINANTALVNGPLTWSLSGPGTLTPNGLSATYTPPATLLADTTVLISATDGIRAQFLSLLVHPAPSLSVSAGAPFAVVGGSNVTLTAIQQFTTAPVTWRLALGNPGTLSATSGNLVNYIPPLSGILPDTTVVTITASAGTLTTTFTLPLHSALGSHWAYALPPGVSYSAIVNGGGKFVAVGESGTIFNSIDGATWTAAAASGTAQNLNGVSFGTVAGIGTFVAVGNAGTILTSTDGITWTPRVAAASTDFFGVIFGNGKFVAVGRDVVSNSGVILTSIDGITWTLSTAANAQTFNSVSFDGISTFVVIGVDLLGTGGKILTSIDNGVTWAAATAPATTFLSGVSFGNGKFVAVGIDALGSGTILTSTGGSVWVAATTIPPTAVLSGVGFGNGIFVAAGVDALGTGAILTSTDGGINWAVPAVTPPTMPFLVSVGFGNGKFVAVGRSGTILNSDATGGNWTIVAAGTALNLFSVGFDGLATFVAVGQSGTILTSVNGGINWAAATVTPATVQDLVGVSFGNGTFVAVGAGSTILTSPNGSSWTPAVVVPATVTNLLSVSFGNGKFVAVGVDALGSGMIITSADGNSWATSTVPANTPFLLGVSFSNGKFLAVGGANTILNSLDGINWTPPATLPVSTQDLLGVSFGNGRYVAVGNGGTIFSSLDGINWFGSASGTAQNLSGVSHGVAVGVIGTILISADEINWIPAVPATVQTLSGVTFGNGKYAAVGASGTVLMSNH